MENTPPRVESRQAAEVPKFVVKWVASDSITIPTYIDVRWPDGQEARYWRAH